MQLVYVSRKTQKLRAKLVALHRYLNEEEIALSSKLMDIIQTRADLDHSLAMQRALKIWLFAHIPLTLTLAVLLVVHVAVVHAF